MRYSEEQLKGDQMKEDNNLLTKRAVGAFLLVLFGTFLLWKVAHGETFSNYGYSFPPLMTSCYGIFFIIVGTLLFGFSLKGIRNGRQKP
jgi:hypothetical protein